MNTPLGADNSERDSAQAGPAGPGRRHWSRTGLGVASIAALLVAVAASSTPAYADRDIEEIEEELETSHQTLEEVVEEYNAIRVELEDTQEMIAELEDTLEPYEEQLEQLYERTSAFIVTAHISQGLGEFERLLEAGSAEALVERMTQLNAANMYDVALIDELVEVSAEYHEQLQLLEDMREDIAAQEEELESMAQTIESEIEALQNDWSEAALSQGTASGVAIDYDLPYIPGDRGKVVRRALSNIGAPYGWGSSGPNAYDCSGLVLDAYREIGIPLPHNAAAQYNQTTPISRDALQPGDLVFYNGLAHMGMYIGDGLIIHASTYSKPAQIVSLDHGNSWYGATTVF
ncbi:C40 family peptidase [Natronoglycomyces albus]|uniref:C40 family peptidase n=1 Tax=Natronoglycomyces albus TaxID=2811108 RepID=A0A895XPU8_9ACTN|nr:NlpC/P60 family protein [Natronoglycomyces albus]QSB05563.1 C40 family peptidase [Natronoglycomyces albus]